MRDKSKKGEAKVGFCPMNDMLGDSFTKPLQVLVCVQMQERIFDLPSSTSTNIHRSVLGGCKKEDVTDGKSSMNL